MSKKIHFLSFIFLSFFCFQKHTIAQTTAAFENLAIHHDKPFYVTGETMWYSIYFLNELTENNSKIVHVKLYNSKGLELVHQKWKRTGAVASGQFFIPLDWQSDTYTLRFYTLWNCNETAYNGHEVQIPIYDTELKQEEMNAILPKKQEAQQMRATTASLQLATAKNSFRRNEAIELSAKLLDEKGQAIAGTISISVVDDDWIPATYLQKNSLPKVETKRLSPRQFQAEQGLTFKATILHPKTKETMNSNFMLLHEIKSNDHFPAKTEAGVLEIELPDYEGLKQMQLLNLDPYLPAAPLVKLIEPRFDFIKKETALTYDSIIYHYQKKTQKARKIEELFTEQQAQLTTVLPDSLPLLEPNKSYQVSEYENMADLFEFIDEVILMARVKGRKDKRTVRLYDEDRNVHYPNAPIYYLNGWLVGNEAEVLKIPLAQIERVELFNERATLLEQQFPRFMAGMGVIAIYTRKSRVPASLEATFSRLTFAGLNVLQDFPKKLKASTTNVSQPDFRPLVHWTPALLLSATQRHQISFLPTSNTGSYWILAKGVTAEGVYVEDFLEVKIER